MRGLDGASATPGAPDHYIYLFQRELGLAWTALNLFADAERVLLESLASFKNLDARLERTPPPEPALARLYRVWGKPELEARYSGD